MSHSETVSGDGGQRVLDAGPFARVVTWDPHRTDGPRAGRLEAFPAEDLFLETDVLRGSDGLYQVIPGSDGLACIGLQWLERRNLRTCGIEFESGGDLPVVGGVEMQAWEGMTLWQGKWVPLAGRLSRHEDRWTFVLDHPDQPVQKVRWIISGLSVPLSVRALSAETLSAMDTSRLMIEMEQDKAGVQAEIETYNGWLVEAGGEAVHQSRRLESSQVITVRHAATTESEQRKADRTVLRFRLPGGSFGVHVNDVLLRGPVYIPHAGLYLSKTPTDQSLIEYRNAIESRKTILEEVQSRPEQTREQAMAVTHCDPRLDHGPIMLSLASDNAKYIVKRNGAIDFVEDFSSDARRDPTTWSMIPAFGGHRMLRFSQGWGVPGINKAAHTDPDKALNLRIGEKGYARGLGHHAHGEIVIGLEGRYERFEAEVGLQWQGGQSPGSVVFEVFVDGAKRFDSGMMREQDEAKPVRVELSGAHTLTLKLSDAGDGVGWDAGNWADAKLVRTDAGVDDLTAFLAKDVAIRRQLAEGWLPAPETTTEVGGIRYRQRSYVVPFADQVQDSASPWLNAKPVGMAELAVENPGDHASPAVIELLFTGRDGQVTVRPSGHSPQRLVVEQGDRLCAVVDSEGWGGVNVRYHDGRCSLSAMVPAGGLARCFVYLPAWRLSASQEMELAGGDGLFSRFRHYWDSVMRGAMQVELPDRWLENVIRANQVHILMAARHEQDGRLVAPWIAADRYLQAIDSEGNSVIRGMQYLGHFEFARRAFAYYFSRYNSEGFMTTGYTLMGNGWHLWAVGEYFRLSGDREWLTSAAPRVVELCRWVIAQCEKTKQLDPTGVKMPEYGLMPPGVQADWNAYAYYFYNNSYFYAGLKACGEALESIGHPEAKTILDAAKALRGEILRAFRQTQAAAPVVPLRDGTWVPYYPSSVHTPGLIADYYPGQDANRSWAYDVDLGPHHMVPLGVMAGDDPCVGWIINHMEDVQFLSSGWGGYPTEMTQAHWFEMGGFAKVQPYYARNAELYAIRDEVKPFIRSYFNTLASLIDGEVLSIYEHFANFCYNKTHETGYFLHQTRTMLLTERDEELWLAPFVPRAWMADGQVIRIRNAPSVFGPVDYSMQSATASGRIDATIELAGRRAPRSVVLRVRHPQAVPIRSVVVNGRPHKDFDAAGEIVRIDPGERKSTIVVHY